MSEFELDPVELKQIAAAEQQKANQLSERVGNVTDSPSQDSVIKVSSTDNRASPGTKRLPYGWVELVAPVSDEPIVRFFSYSLTLASLAIPLAVNHVVFVAFNGGLILKLGIVAASIMFSIWLFTYARRMRAPNAADVMSKDSRRPVLLLRAFEDDYSDVENASPSGDWRQVGAKLGLTKSISFEELLYDVFSQCGPVIAIGRPGETVPPLGAFRFWVSESRWRDAVEYLLKECQRVVLIMGQLKGKEGLTWEAKKLLSLENLKKVVLIVPPEEEEEVKQRWESYREISANRLPPFQGGEVAVGFDSQNTCQVVRVVPKRGHSDREESVYREAIRVPQEFRVGAILVTIVLAVLWVSDFLAMALPGIQLVRESRQRDYWAKEARRYPDEVIKSTLLGKFGLCVDIVDAPVARQLELRPKQGLLIYKVEPGSPAVLAGFQEDTVLVEMNGQPISDDELEFSNQLEAHLRNPLYAPPFVPLGFQFYSPEYSPLYDVNVMKEIVRNHPPVFKTFKVVDAPHGWLYDWTNWASASVVLVLLLYFFAWIIGRPTRRQTIGSLDFR